MDQRVETSTQAAAPPPAGRAKRHWFRFSLLTLVLFVLLIGSSMGLWWKRAPWVAKEMRSDSNPNEAPVYSPDGQCLAAQCGDHKMRVWDTATGDTLKLLDGRESWVSCIAFSADGRYLAAGYWDKKSVDVWDLVAGTRLAELAVTGEGDFQPRRISVDGRAVFARTWDSVYSWGLRSGEEQFIVGSHFAVVDGPDVQANFERAVKGALAADTLDVFCKNEAEGCLGLHATLSPDCRLILTCLGASGEAQLWDAQTRKRLRTFQLPEGMSSVSEGLFSPDGRYLLLKPHKEEIAHVWDVQKEQQVLSLPFAGWLDDNIGYHTYEALGFSKDGMSLVLRRERTATDTILSLWATGTWQKTHEANLGDCCIQALSPDTSRCVTVGSHGGEVWLWDTRSGKKLFRLCPPNPELDNDYGSGFVVFAPDGTTFATDGPDGKLFLWSRRRPEYWWGLAWLPEFWLTMVFAGGLVWSVRRDRRIL